MTNWPQKKIHDNNWFTNMYLNHYEVGKQLSLIKGSILVLQTAGEFSYGTKSPVHLFFYLLVLQVLHKKNLQDQISLM